MIRRKVLAILAGIPLVGSLVVSPHKSSGDSFAFRTNPDGSPRVHRVAQEIQTFWVQSDQARLIAAARSISNCVIMHYGDDGLFWKVGLDARVAIYKCGTAISVIDEIPQPERSYVSNRRMSLSGIPGDVQDVSFPRKQIHLFSPIGGRVGIIDII